jgi:hypothetical protein
MSYNEFSMIIYDVFNEDTPEKARLTSFPEACEAPALSKGTPPGIFPVEHYLDLY